MSTKIDAKRKRKGATFPRPDFSKDKLVDAPAEYLERLQSFSDVVADCANVTRRFGGYSSPTSQHFYASVLFTSMCTRATSLAILAPYSEWAKRKFEHWDFASVANVARSIMEFRLNFHYLCIDEIPREEWECRWNVFNLHDCKSRKELFSAFSEMTGKESEQDFSEPWADLVARLEKNSHFQALSTGQKKSILNGGKSHLLPLEEIAVKAGIETGLFRFMWKLMSTHAHGLPMSFYRMQNDDRGRGVQTPVEEHYTILLLSFCMSMLVSTRDEFVALMGNIEQKKREIAYAFHPESENLK